MSFKKLLRKKTTGAGAKKRTDAGSKKDTEKKNQKTIKRRKSALALDWRGGLFNSADRRLSYDDLINAESSLGRTLFGPIPEGHQREFFALRRNSWMWYENWFDEAGRVQEMMLKYEVRPDGVYKKPRGGSYTKIEGGELNNFIAAVKGYYALVMKRLYS